MDKKENSIERLQSQTLYKENYYMFFCENVKKTSSVQTILHEWRILEKFGEFISWVENQSRKKLERYCDHRVKTFDNRVFKISGL